MEYVRPRVLTMGMWLHFPHCHCKEQPFSLHCREMFSEQIHTAAESVLNNQTQEKFKTTIRRNVSDCVTRRFLMSVNNSLWPMGKGMSTTIIVIFLWPIICKSSYLDKSQGPGRPIIGLRIDTMRQRDRDPAIQFLGPALYFIKGCTKIWVPPAT